MVQALSDGFPLLVEDLVKEGSKPVKLLILESITPIFQDDDAKKTSSALVDRSKGIYEVAALLHRIASEHNIAVVVINDVIDVFSPPVGQPQSHEGDLLYRDQSYWFGTASTVPGEDKKEAKHALVWANQINVRILLTRTERRIQVDQEEPPLKRRRVEAAASEHEEPLPRSDDAIVLRRLSVVFSSISTPCSIDYIVTANGVCSLPGD